MVSNSFPQSAPVLVLGATGKTGSRVAQRLQALGQSIRLGSRTHSSPFDWYTPSTWPAVCQGMRAVYLTFQPDLASPQAPAIIESFVRVAQQNGIRQMVLLSGRGEPQAQACEQAIMNSGLNWTILRASWFNQNFSEGYLLEAVLSGLVALPAGNIPEPFIDADDIADVAVVSLTQEGHAHQVYELTGPHLLTFDEAINTIAQATGRRIEFKSVPIEAYHATLLEHDVPEPYIELLLHLFVQTLDGRNAQLADGVQRVLGRQPIDFSTYVRKTAAIGSWNQVRNR